MNRKATAKDGRVSFLFFFLTSMLMAGDPGEKRGKGVAGGILVAVFGRQTAAAVNRNDRNRGGTEHEHDGINDFDSLNENGTIKCI